MSTAVDALKRLKILASVRAKTHPAVFLPVARLRENNKRRCVRRSTDLVIEGYWRTANHYAAYSFILAQGERPEVAHHFHAPAQALLGHRWGRPVLVLTREPAEAVASAGVLLGLDDPITLLRCYLLFYEPLLPIAREIVIADFAQTTREFPRVVARLNDHYGTSFAAPNGSADEEAVVSGAITLEHRLNMHADPRSFPLPSGTKEELKEAIRERSVAGHAGVLLSEARGLYHELISGT